MSPGNSATGFDFLTPEYYQSKPRHLAPSNDSQDFMGPRFACLAPGTDLNQPPATCWSLGGWEPYRLFPPERPPAISSTAASACSQPNFIAAADNLKSLLQLPYSTSPVSLCVRRVGSTILLDDATPVYSAAAATRATGLFGNAAANPSLAGEHDSAPQGRLDSTQQQLLESKLLYHSLSLEAGLQRLEAGSSLDLLPQEQQADRSLRANRLQADVLPEPKLLEGVVAEGVPSQPHFSEGALALWGSAQPDSTTSGTPQYSAAEFPADCYHKHEEVEVADSALVPAFSRSQCVPEGGAQGRSESPQGISGEVGRHLDIGSLPPLFGQLVEPGACQMRPPLRAAIAATHEACGSGAAPARHPLVSYPSRVSYPSSRGSSRGVSSSHGSSCSRSRSSSPSSSGRQARAFSRNQQLAMVHSREGVPSEARKDSDETDGESACSTESMAGESVDDVEEEEEEEEAEMPDGQHRSMPRRNNASWDGFDQSHLFEWKLKEFTVLVESDLVMFRNRALEPVSLKLASVDDRVTTLTCLSTWLDNIFAGVEDLAICYHREGCVTGYQMLKTEALPKMSQPTFAPDRVLDHANHVFSFLQNNCTTDRATYWLLRDPTSDMLRLYDVSEMLEAASQANDHNAIPHPAGSTSTSTSAAHGSSMEVPEHVACGEAGGLPVATSALALPAEAAGFDSNPNSSIGRLCFRLAELLPMEDSKVRKDRLKMLRQSGELLDPTFEPLLYAEAHEQVADMLLMGAEVDADDTPTAGPGSSLATKGSHAAPALPLPPPTRGAEGAAAQRPRGGRSGSGGGGLEKETSQRRKGGGVPPPALSEGHELARASRNALELAMAHTERVLDVFRTCPAANLGGSLLAAQGLQRIKEKQARVLLELSRQQYCEEELGVALHLAQEVLRLCPTASAPLVLIADVHAALRCNMLPAERARHQREWDARRSAAVPSAEPGAQATPSKSPSTTPVKGAKGAAAAAEGPETSKEGSRPEGWALRQGPAVAGPETHLDTALACYKKAIHQNDRETRVGADAARSNQPMPPCSPTSSRRSGRSNSGAGGSRKERSTCRRKWRGQALASVLGMPPVQEEGEPMTEGAAAAEVESEVVCQWGLQLSDWADARRTVLRRLGSLHNEAGQRALTSSSKPQGEQPGATTAASELMEGIRLAEHRFREAIAAFEAAGDGENVALLLSNLAKLARQRAAISSPLHPHPSLSLSGIAAAAGVTPPVVQQYVEAANLCRAGLEVLGRKENQEWVWNAVQMELASCHLAEGVFRLQRRGAEVEEAEAEAEVAVDLLTRALQTFTAVGNAAASQVAIAHFHLGHALSDRALREEEALQGSLSAHVARKRRPPKVMLPMRHLEKCLAFFTAEAYPVDFVRTKLQLARLYEGLCPPSLERALQHIVSTSAALHRFAHLYPSQDLRAAAAAPAHAGKSDTAGTATAPGGAEDSANGGRKALQVEAEVEVALGRVLRELIRTAPARDTSSNTGGGAVSGGRAVVYRQLYRIALQGSGVGSGSSSGGASSGDQKAPDSMATLAARLCEISALAAEERLF
ncbi:hypothetical protein CYMTET_7815 [Cymbomonas tetramitiformis]|uniref:Erythroid differentiation-related factor 1 n=1 Tax=Cymbomonas tetramitiformis TaxID=36881 RepID=A0AAE0GUA2_9CHLO|nr:hypothetical protein CYMTET_7815 [Cymbomonas tetramitiformis]